MLTAYAAAIDTCELDRGRRYHDFTQSQLSAHAKRILEAIVPADGYQWRSDFALEHQAEGERRGRCQGEATAVLDVLDARGIEATPQQREWITQCTEEDTLRTWLRRAATAKTADEVFG
ncbi:MAG: hypothetical protein GEV11_23020 [Streptosporangiales bacterium]|nr:hypothetical protein [Streptosporangiales bacterium]